MTERLRNTRPASRIARRGAFRRALRWRGTAAATAAWGLLQLGCGGDGSPGGVRLPERISYNRDVRPILADGCYPCHGPDEGHRKAELRLDVRESALLERDGIRAILPGDTAQSDLVRRIHSSDPAERMPPPQANRSLTRRERALLTRWIEEGAEYEPHWSYRPLARPEPPAVENESWVRGPIDRFVLARLEAEGIGPSAPAPAYQLLRRASFDLVGLPADPEEVRAFEAEPSGPRYARFVARLLDSPHYGERMALAWLDLVRYADTNGYHADEHRNVHPYRDYVIRAFQEGKPFDAFTVEQIAGDLLPDGDLQARVASGYNRLNQITTESGAQAREYRAKYMADRVRTTAAVWLGSTLGCAECHDHKFDPFSMRDFYAFGAFFSDLDERAVYSPAFLSLPPELPVPSAAQRSALAEIDATEQRVRLMRRERAQSLGPPFRSSLARWEAGLIRPGLEELRPDSASAEYARLEIAADGTVSAGGQNADAERYELVFPTPGSGAVGLQLEVLPDPTLPRNGPGRSEDGSFILSELSVWTRAEPGTSPRPLEIARASASFESSGASGVGRARLAIDGEHERVGVGWSIAGGAARRHVAFFEFEEPLSGDDATLGVELRMNAGAGRSLGRFRLRAVLPPQAPAQPPDSIVPEKWKTLIGADATTTSFRLLGSPGGKAGVRRAVTAPGVDYEIDLLISDIDLPGRDDQLEWRIAPPFLAEREGVRLRVGRQDGELALVTRTIRDDPATYRAQKLPTLEEDRTLWLKLRWVESRTAWRIFYATRPDGTLRELAGGALEVPWSSGEVVTNRIELTSGARGAAAATLAGFRVRPHALTLLDLPIEVARRLELPASERSPSQQQVIDELYYEISPGFEGLNERLGELAVRRAALEAEVPSTLVSASLGRRPVRVLRRGNWMDESGPQVEPSVPAFLASRTGPVEPDRLALARWIASPENPLTARVAVNRLWKLMFGRGLVRTPDDFGSQGSWPTHPDLLDWLAVEFIESGWDVKHLLRLIASSSAYRQSSAPRADLLESDPENRWLARQGRFRLDAELVRDTALAISGLLTRKVGGRSVKPYQPDGYWKQVASVLRSPATEWLPAPGAEQYRRGLYTYWKRSFPHPSLVAFDAPSREECVAQRARSSSPLQSLVLLNDPTYVEAAVAFAGRILREGGRDAEERIRWAHRVATGRGPSDAVSGVLRDLYDEHRKRYHETPRAARAIGRAGRRRLPKGVAPEELAAWTSVARVLLNLDEAIARL